MKKVLTVLSVVFVLVMVFFCSGAVSAADKLKVALVLPGKADDVSFNQAMYRGAMAFAALHPDAIELKVVEGVYDVADIDPTLRDYADAGYDVIIGHGYQFTEPVDTVAEQYPEVVFLLGCGVKYRANSQIYDVQLEAGGYLMGVVAALATQSGKVGVIGGGEGSEITRGHEGFKAGAKFINPDIDIQEVYTGDWNDTTGAYEAAIGMYDSGVDVIWHSGDGIGLGVVQAAEEKDQYVLGNVEGRHSLPYGLDPEHGNGLRDPGRSGRPGREPWPARLHGLCPDVFGDDPRTVAWPARGNAPCGRETRHLPHKTNPSTIFHSTQVQKDAINPLP